MELIMGDKRKKANTEIPNYWLQVYDCNRFYIAAIYGISSNGIFELMGNEYCDSIESAKKNCEEQWKSFQENSRLYPKKGKKNE